MSSEQQMADVLDACLEALRQGASLEQALARHPDHAEALRPLLELAQRLEALPSPQPSVSGLMKLVAELAAAPARQGGKIARLLGGSRPAWALAAAALLMVLVAGWGTVALSASSVPGDLLYPLKTLSEKVQWRLAMTPEEKAELRIVFSEERLREAVRKYRRQGTVDERLLAAMLAEAERALLASEKLPPDRRELVLQQLNGLAEYEKNVLGCMGRHGGQHGRRAIGRHMRRFEQHCRRVREAFGKAQSKCEGSSRWWSDPRAQGETRERTAIAANGRDQPGIPRRGNTR